MYIVHVHRYTTSYNSYKLWFRSLCLLSYFPDIRSPLCRGLTNSQLRCHNIDCVCFSCCSSNASASAAAPQLRQLLLLDCIKCCSLIVSTVAPRLRQLLLLDCVLPWISMHSPQLHVHVLLPDLNYCFPIASDSAVTHELHLLPLLLPDRICFFSGCAHKSCSRYTKRTRAGSGHDI